MLRSSKLINKFNTAQSNGGTRVEVLLFIGANLSKHPKVLGREFEGDSPQGGEMSRSDRGDGASATLFQKVFPQ